MSGPRLEAVLVEVVARALARSGGRSRPRGTRARGARASARRPSTISRGLCEGSRAREREQPLRARGAVREREHRTVLEVEVGAVASGRRPAEERGAGEHAADDCRDRATRYDASASSVFVRGFSAAVFFFAAPASWPRSSSSARPSSSCVAVRAAALRRGRRHAASAGRTTETPPQVPERRLQVVEDEPDGRVAGPSSRRCVACRRGRRRRCRPSVATSSCVEPRRRSREIPVRVGQSSRGRRGQLVGAAASASVEPATAPFSSKTTAASICDEISVRSASACWASIGRSSIELPPRAGATTRPDREVLRRPRHAPRGDDRLLRAALLRAADVPRARAARPRRPRRRVDASSSRRSSTTLPGTPIDRIVDLVHKVQDNAATLGHRRRRRRCSGRRSRSSACSSRRSTSSTAGRTVRSCTGRRLRRC